MARHRRRHQRRRVALAAVVATLVGVTVIGFRLGESSGAPASPPSTTTSTAPPPSTSPPSTTTTVPVGSLPQTRTLPPPITPGLTQRMMALLKAISTGEVSYGIPAFFPILAYVQTKVYADSAYDWRTRLIPEYASDIHSLHATLDPNGAPMRLLGYAVDDAAAVWVLPGQEFNKGPYWRVYDAVVAYAIGAARGSFTINTLISWRGEWYVTHVSSFNS